MVFNILVKGTFKDEMLRGRCFLKYNRLLHLDPAKAMYALSGAYCRASAWVEISAVLHSSLLLAAESRQVLSPRPSLGHVEWAPDQRSLGLTPWTVAGYGFLRGRAQGSLPTCHS